MACLLLVYKNSLLHYTPVQYTGHAIIFKLTSAVIESTDWWEKDSTNATYDVMYAFNSTVENGKMLWKFFL